MKNIKSLGNFWSNQRTMNSEQLTMNRTMQENVLKIKSYDFAIRIVRLSQYLQTDKKEFVLSKQI